MTIKQKKSKLVDRRDTTRHDTTRHRDNKNEIYGTTNKTTRSIHLRQLQPFFARFLFRAIFSICDFYSAIFFFSILFARAIVDHQTKITIGSRSFESRYLRIVLLYTPPLPRSTLFVNRIQNTNDIQIEFDFDNTQ